MKTKLLIPTIFAIAAGMATVSANAQTIDDQAPQMQTQTRSVVVDSGPMHRDMDAAQLDTAHADAAIRNEATSRQRQSTRLPAGAINSGNIFQLRGNAGG